MARDIDDFLRRAAERRQQKAAGAAPTPPRQQPPRQQKTVRNVPLRQQPLEPIVIQAEVAPPQRTHELRSGSVSDHVQSHINTSRISDHAEHLGHRIKSLRDRTDERVHQHLDHDINRIDDRPTITDNAPRAIFGAPNSNLADDLIRIMSNPKSAGQAILIAEILKRPDFN